MKGKYPFSQLQPSHNHPFTVTEWREGGKTARLQYDPDRELMPKDGVIHGQLEVHYDVQRALDAGDIQVMRVVAVITAFVMGAILVMLVVCSVEMPRTFMAFCGDGEALCGIL